MSRGCMAGLGLPIEAIPSYIRCCRRYAAKKTKNILEWLFQALYYNALCLMAPKMEHGVYSGGRSLITKADIIQ